MLVGGGHSHVHVLASLARRPIDGLRTTVVSREVLTPYSGMLPGYVAGHYNWLDIHIDLAPLCTAAGARLISGTAKQLDLESRQLICTNRPPVRFDLLSINVGAAPATGEIHGADRFGIAVKPINRFVPQWQALLERLLAEPDRPVRIAIIGGGASGVELGLAIDHRLRIVEGLKNVEMILVSAAPEIVAGHNPATRRFLIKELGRRKFDLHLGARVIAVEDGALETDVDGRLGVDEVLWVTQAAPQPWPAEAGLVVDADGFIVVNEKLQSLSDPEVFAAGDIATVDGEPRPKAGVFAVRQGVVLAENLRRAAAGETLQSFRPQDRFLSLISTGRKSAIASRGDFAAAGHWAWRWKDWIDRRFMARFAVRDRPERKPRPAISTVFAPGDTDMDENAEAGGREILERVFARLNISMQAESLAGARAGTALLRPVVNSFEVQSISGIGELLTDPYVLGGVFAAHAMNEVFAVGGVPRSALVSVTLPRADEACIEEDVFLLFAGIIAALEPVGASVAAGHVRIADALNVDIAMTGTVDEPDVMQRRRASIDDLLILTKPVGTGALLSAARDARCRSDWYFSAIDSMQVIHQQALIEFRVAGVRSCTAVGESGLLGHMRELAGAARLTTELWPEHIPMLAGVAELLGAESVNARSPEGVDCGVFAPGDPRVRVLSDAQLSGGMLAAVRADKAVQCLASLRANGYVKAAIVGRVCAQSGEGPWCRLTQPDSG